MKRFLITVLTFSISIAEAQNIKEFVIEPAPESTESVFSGSCNSPELGVVVFKTAITGLWFEMYPPSKLAGMRQNRQRNEYVMCVEPTDGKYRFTITHADYESVDFFVENIKPNQTQYFKINTKDSPGVNEIISEEPVGNTTLSTGIEPDVKSVINATLGAGLVAYYTFDNENAHDATVNELHATLINNPGFTGETVSGKGKALFLNSSRQQFMNIPYNPLKGEKNYTVSLWVKDFGAGSLFSAVSGIYYQYDVPRLWATPEGTFELYTFTVGGTLRPTVTPFSYSYREIQSGKWHLITIVCKQSGNSGIKELYIDGILTDSVNDNISDHYGERTKIQIGGNGDGKYSSFSSSMQVDNIRIYNRSLDPKEVMAIYNFEK